MSTREKLEEGFASYLGTEVYLCHREYSAWSCGTMQLEDFSLAREDPEILDSLVEIAVEKTNVENLQKMHELALADIQEYSDIIQSIKDELSSHPRVCDKYTEDDVISCGWKRALQSIERIVNGTSD